MTKKVLFLTNDNDEMMEIVVDGKSIFYGNYWDFSVDDIPPLLGACGVDCEKGRLPDWEEVDEESEHE